MHLVKMHCCVLNFAVLSSVLAYVCGVGIGGKQDPECLQSLRNELGLGAGTQREAGENQVLTGSLLGLWEAEGDVNSVHKGCWHPTAVV